MEMKLVAKMQLGMVMTPQLKMAIKLLTLNHLELKDAVAQELVENPVLEEAMDDPRAPTEAREAEVPALQEPIGPAQNEVTPEQGPKDEGVDWEAFADSYSFLPPGAGGAGGAGGDGEEMPGIEQTFTRGDTLEQHLLWQVRMSDMSELERDIALHLLGDMSDDGFLDCRPVQVPVAAPIEMTPKKDDDADVDAAELEGDKDSSDDNDDDEEVPEPVVAALTADPVAMIAEDLEVPIEWVEAVRRRMMRMDPVGVMAKTLQESLVTQLEVWGYDDECLAYQIVVHHLRDAERKNYLVIQRAWKCTLEDIGEAMKIIEQLEPRPARNFLAQGDSDNAQHITPDAFVHKVGHDWVVNLNDDGIPRLRMSQFYLDKLRQDARARALAKAKGEKSVVDPSRAFITEKKRTAEWLIKSLHQRQRTIYRVVESIVRHQRDWFERSGPLKPLILKQVADDIELTPGKTIHESTVSRVTTRKYMQTPRGIFELKYFFNSLINTGDGDNIASEAVKDEIRRIVSAENVKKPLSDQTIVKMLQGKNIEIARRTVAKYREMLGILPSSRRKQVF